MKHTERSSIIRDSVRIEFLLLTVKPVATCWFCVTLLRRKQVNYFNHWYLLQLPTLQLLTFNHSRNVADWNKSSSEFTCTVLNAWKNQHVIKLHFLSYYVFTITSFNLLFSLMLLYQLKYNCAKSSSLECFSIRDTLYQIANVFNNSCFINDSLIFIRSAYIHITHTMGYYTLLSATTGKLLDYIQWESHCAAQEQRIIPRQHWQTLVSLYRDVTSQRSHCGHCNNNDAA